MQQVFRKPRARRREKRVECQRCAMIYLLMISVLLFGQVNEARSQGVLSSSSSSSYQDYSDSSFANQSVANVILDYSPLIDADDPSAAETTAKATSSINNDQQKTLWRRQVILDGSGDTSELASSLDAASNSQLDYGDFYRGSQPTLDDEGQFSAQFVPTSGASHLSLESGSVIQQLIPDRDLDHEDLSSKSITTTPIHSIQKQQQTEKMGPQFTKEPPSYIHYLNSSDLVIACSASGNPSPTITWWHKSSQLEVGSLLDKRYVRYDNSLVISAFKAHEFEPSIHSTTYKCQASNSIGTIVSRDIVIEAVIDQKDFSLEISVSDQFVTVNDDALFRCQLPAQWRDFFHLVGWLEDGQHLASVPLIQQQQQQQQQQSPLPRAFILPDGQLYVQRVQLRDANKSYRCQVKNLLTGQLHLSSLSGRLFVTDANEQGGAGGVQPRIVDSPQAITYARPTSGLEQQSTSNNNNNNSPPLLLGCLAQGSPRPTLRWFKQQFGSQDWTELRASSKQDQQQDHASKTSNNSNQPYTILAEGNLLLIKSIQANDNRCKFRCLANNTLGMNHADTELRLEMYPQSKMVEVEPKVEYIENSSELGQQQQQQQRQQQPEGTTRAHLNCTIRASSLPLIAIEWLKNGKLLASVSLTQVHNYNGIGYNNHNVYISSNHSSSSSSIASMFDDPNQELTLIEQLALTANEAEQDPNDEQLLSSSSSLYQSATTSNQNQLHLETTLVSSTSSLAKLEAQSLETQSEASNGLRRISQRIRFSQKDQTILYQLRFNQLRRSDRGSYQCRGRNPRTIIHSTGQLMLKDSPPIFIETFQNQLINTKSIHLSQASLKCIASGSPLPEISWRLSGFQIPESSSYRVGDYVTRDGLIVSFVNISNVQAEDGGLYECSATNDVGQLRHSAWLNVTGAPYVRSMPNVSAIAGSSMSIMCPVGGWPIDQISWFQNSSKLPVNHRQKLFPNGTLLISELNEVTDSGQYSCQAKWTANELSASNSLHVSIKVPPVVEPFSFAKSLHRGQRYNIMCTVVRGDLPVSIRWFKDGRQLLIHEQQEENTNNNNIAIKQLDPYSSTLTFASLQPNHRGLYTCEAANEAGRANQSSQLVIHVPPGWRIEPRDMSVTVGKTAVIDCQADAFPAARIEWRLSQDLYREPPTEFKPIISSLYMRVFENGSLIIYNTQRTDAGYYLCQASNGVGPGLSRVVKLTVHVAAHFKNKIRTELVRRGQAARLKCESIGDPPLEINWLKDKMPLYVSDEGARYALTKTPLPDGLLSELQISETTRTDSALFTCITQNQFGNDDTNIQLVVQSQPDPPADIRIQEYEARSVKISWSAGHSGNLPISRYIIQYAQTSSLNGAGSVESNGFNGGGSSSLMLVAENGQTSANPVLQYVNVSVPGNESTIVLTGLTPLTEYQFFMFSVNSIGSSRAQTEPIKFRTDDEAPAGPPLFAKAQALSSHSIRVRWRSPERRAQQNYGSITGYYVGYKQLKPEASQQSRTVGSGDTTFVYKTVELPTLEINSNRSFNNPNSNQEHECTLIALRRGQKYLINIQAFNSRGAGPASEPIVAETWRIDVPDAPTLRMILRTTHSIHLAWRLAHSSSGQSLDATGLSSAQAAKLINSRKSIINRASQQYEQQTSGTAAASPPAAMAQMTTVTNAINQNEPPASDDEREAELAQANEPILGFILIRRQISSSANNFEGQPVELRLPSDHLSQIVDNLTCGTRYQFTIIALNSVGPSQPSDPLVIKTEGSTPVAPDKNSLILVNSSSVLINLAAWHNGACAMRQFEVMFKPSKSKKWTPISLTQANNLTESQTGKVSSALGFNHPDQSLVQRSVAFAQQQQPASGSPALNTNSTIVLEDLSSAINYDLKIVAVNEAGSTEALYTFSTSNNHLRQMETGELWPSGDFQLADASLSELLSVSSPIISWLILSLFLLLAITTGCILFARRRHLTSSSCSLSLSSASRSNQSSSNYYTSSGATTTTTATSALANLSHPSGHVKLNGLNTLQKLHLIDEHENEQQGPEFGHYSQNHIHLNDIQARSQQQPSNMLDESNYAYMATNPNQRALRSTSPQDIDINGGETEMCLGASALNIAAAAAASASAATNHNDNQGKRVQATYYVAPMQLVQSNKQAAIYSNKSSTLPANCHQQQQLLHQMIHQQQAHNESANQQQLIDNLVATNMLHHQQQQQPQVHHNNLPDGFNQESQLIGPEAMASLLEQQLQQQVYATVKRGCPRPPRLCDYTIYQCPAAVGPDNHNENQQQLMRCCVDLQQQQQLPQIQSSINQQDHGICYHINEDCSRQQQQQQQHSDYQQLRPMN